MIHQQPQSSSLVCHWVAQQQCFMFMHISWDPNQGNLLLQGHHLLHHLHKSIHINAHAYTQGIKISQPGARLQVIHVSSTDMGWSWCASQWCWGDVQTCNADIHIHAHDMSSKQAAVALPTSSSSQPQHVLFETRPSKCGLPGIVVAEGLAGS